MTKPKNKRIAIPSEKEKHQSKLGSTPVSCYLTQVVTEQGSKKNWLETLGEFDLRRNARSKELHFLQGRSPVVC